MVSDHSKDMNPEHTHKKKPFSITLITDALKYVYYFILTNPTQSMLFFSIDIWSR